MWDIADILVVSVLIYAVLNLIKGTRAVQMATGALLLVAVFYLSRFSRLDTFNWLVRNVLGYIVFAIIVLFQSDIRRALAHLGRAPFFRYLTTEESAEGTSSRSWSSPRTCWPPAHRRDHRHRTADWPAQLSGGIALDAVLTYDLIVSIFQRSSPLHDGAVIVQNDRVAAAACFLPLTVNPKLAKELGSRHRAAIGLTEENDSVAIVVSEETGTVSIVVDGQIERGLDPGELRARLRSLVLGKRSAPSRSPARVQYT
jgi:DNA integrity scanning protein DisA with diadenylate cyclase activity